MQHESAENYVVLKIHQSAETGRSTKQERVILPLSQSVAKNFTSPRPQPITI